jgi:hypothetical protein
MEKKKEEKEANYTLLLFVSLSFVSGGLGP